MATELFNLQNPLDASLPVRVRTQTGRQAPRCRGVCKSLTLLARLSLFGGKTLIRPRF